MGLNNTRMQLTPAISTIMVDLPFKRTLSEFGDTMKTCGIF